jgi:hypothetical protein
MVHHTPAESQFGQVNANQGFSGHGRRPDFEHLEFEITIDDPGAYTKPFTLFGHSTIETDTEIMEYICNENNQDVIHITGKDSRN